MILAIDAGNNKVAFGIFDGDGPPARSVSISLDEFRGDSGPEALSRALAKLETDARHLNGVSIASVVPDLTPGLVESARRLTPRVLNLDPASFAPMPVRYNPPADLGADRLANALATHSLYGGPACSVDMGTATSFDVVTATGEFAGGAIAPGLDTAARALFQKAARLKSPGWKLPARALGQSTSDCLLSGTVLGYAGLVDEMVRLLEAEAGPFVRVVATGGMAGFVAQVTQTINEVRPSLTLEGLAIAFRLTGRESPAQEWIPDRGPE